MLPSVTYLILRHDASSSASCTVIYRSNNCQWKHNPTFKRLLSTNTSVCDWRGKTSDNITVHVVLWKYFSKLSESNDSEADTS